SASAVTLSGAAARTRPEKARIPSGTTVTDQGEPPSATRPDRHLTPGVQVTGPAAAVSAPVRSGGAGTGVISADPGVGASLLSGDPSSGSGWHDACGRPVARESCGGSTGPTLSTTCRRGFAGC